MVKNRIFYLFGNKFSHIVNNYIVTKTLKSFNNNLPYCK